MIQLNLPHNRYNLVCSVLQFCIVHVCITHQTFIEGDCDGPSQYGAFTFESTRKVRRVCNDQRFYIDANRMFRVRVPIWDLWQY